MSEQTIVLVTIAGNFIGAAIGWVLIYLWFKLHRRY